MTISDKILGFALVATAGLIFVYYTVWVLVLPFVEEPVILNLFPPRIYAIAIPASVLVLTISVVGAFIGVVLIKESKRNKMK
mmetsp:Transcript_25884/g.24709  ORF Transcript_25884/g.24709 Transcript_25884/m.24709 type:complete len:82 (-) Transcript_25884:296-541(-)